jgi:hypothetical protein
LRRPGRGAALNKKTAEKDFGGNKKIQGGMIYEDQQQYNGS